ncbi:hypothetical protein SPSYN_00970 [Sporotomaculum syntrophicum]|uniref:DUF763 domain-containing protein n=1 Tax=Sporotomaculum syntrophicum TaxID=182264 RepID=A0A9D2WSR2_9FIRM|nr:DUF763 domain-containing protein [Sporotomaculum syntrophicum]KAF1086226.1 hypothetical protein SPSYN_00970 [Sporotomaculum syntrophicum]
MRTGIANLPLHGHHCPRWLFERMVRLSAAIVEAVVEEFGPREVLRRMSDPFWFQAFGCVVGFDWHSSGLTTVLCGALKQGMADRQKDAGIFFAGGKAMTSRKTPLEIAAYTDRYALPDNVANLQYASRMCAKVDSAAVQDGYQIYQHFFMFTGDGSWAVVQQGMDGQSGWARRYHWLSDNLRSYVEEPHAAVCGQNGLKVLNMVARESDQARNVSVFQTKEKPEKIISSLKKIAALPREQLARLDLPAAHPVPQAGRIEKTLRQLYDLAPQNYEQLLSVQGVGPATVRAFALVGEVVYGVKASLKDPVRYSFAHGGKDGHPYPVDRNNYDLSINMLETALRRLRVGERDKMDALRRLAVLQKNFTY